MRIRNVVLAVVLAFWLCSAMPGQENYCGVQSVRGTWAFSGLGWAIPLGPPADAPPVVFMGVLTIDSAGKMTGPMTVISGAGIPGTPIPAGTVLDFDLVGSVEVTPGCTGIWRYSIQLKGTPAPIPGQYVERIIVVPQKDEIMFMSIRSPLSKPMWVGTAKRLQHLPTPVTWPAAPAQD